MRLVGDSAAIDEGSGFSAAELGLAHKEMNRDVLRHVFDDFLTALARWRRRILALPVEGALVDPVIVIPMLLGLALLVQGHQEDVHLLVVEHDMTDVPAAGVE